MLDYIIYDSSQFLVLLSERRYPTLKIDARPGYLRSKDGKSCGRIQIYFLTNILEFAFHLIIYHHSLLHNGYNTVILSS